MAEAALIPCLRAQDAVARLEAAVQAASAGVAEGLRARLGLIEAAGFLGHRGAAVHPHDLALREAHITGSYSVAAHAGRLRRVLPWSAADGLGDGAPDDLLVGAGLAYARLWRRLGSFATVQPLSAAAQLAGQLGELGAAVAPQRLAAWCGGLPGAHEQAALPAAAAVLAAGAPADAAISAAHAVATGAGQPLDLAAAYLAACLWKRHGFGLGIALPFWAAPLSRLDALARQSEAAFLRPYLDCVSEAALRGRRELARLLAAEQRIRTLPGRAGGHLPAAAEVALRRPLVTAGSLADALGVTARAGLDLTDRLVAAGLLREATGRRAWRAYVLA